MKFKNILLLLLVLSFIIAVAGCLSDNNSFGEQQVTPQEQPTLQQQPTPIKGSIHNPAGINETLTIEDAGEVYNFSVVQVIRGNQIDNDNIEKPTPGFEYLLVYVKLAYNHLYRDDATYVYPDEFNAYCDNVECDRASIGMTNDINFNDGNVMPGGVKEGWIAYTVPQGKEVVIGFQPGAYTSKNCFVSVGSK